MNTILVFVVLLGFVLCEEPQPPQALPEVEKPEAVPVKGMMEEKMPGRRGYLGKKFDNLSEEEKAEVEKKREQIQALSSRKEKIEALRKLREENPKVYKVLKTIFKKVVRKPKRGNRNGSKRKMGSLGFRRNRKLSRGWQKGKKERKFFKKKPFGPKNLPEPMKPMPAKPDAVSVEA